MRLEDADTVIERIEQEIQRIEERIERIKRLQKEGPDNLYHNFEKELDQCYKNKSDFKTIIHTIKLYKTTYVIHELIAYMIDCVAPTRNRRHKFCEKVKPEYCARLGNCADCIVNTFEKFIKSATEGENE